MLKKFNFWDLAPQTTEFLMRELRDEIPETAELDNRIFKSMKLHNL